MTSETGHFPPSSQYETPTHREIIDRAGGPSKVAEALRSDPPVDRERIKGWARNDSIPGPYFQSFVDADLATYEELGAAAARRKTADALKA